MVRRVITHVKYPTLIAGIVLCLVGVALQPFDWAQGKFGSVRAYVASGNIDPNNKYAWGANVGWINFAPTHGGVTVYADHLEGYAWGENIGWIRLGSYGDGGAHTYANDAAGTYGVNRDGDGNLSGYAWGTNVGWINFDPTHGGVTIDPDTGSFDGYAWGENVGWIHFKNASPEYNVVTAFREENLPKPALVKTVSPASAKPGQAITYTIAFSNTGAVTATNVVITDTVPVSVTNTSVISSGVAITQAPGSRYVWTAPDLAQNEGGVITITGVLTKRLAAGVFTNTVTMAVSGTVEMAGIPLEVVTTVAQYTCYLPLVSRNYLVAPDLVVESVTATGDSVQVVVENEGNASVTDEFWVQVYIDPNPAPTAVNQLWYDLGDEGMLWGVTSAALPLAPGGTITLTVGDGYYWPTHSRFDAPLAAGTPVYAQVDAWNGATTYGAVLESHEITGDTYNNVSGPFYRTAIP